MRVRPTASAALGMIAAASAFVSGLAVAPDAEAQGRDGITLAPHRAVYEMSLGQTRSGSGVSSVKGRMVYELTGSACEGYTQNMRFVTEMMAQEGQPTLTDLRSSTWEDGQASIFRFNSSTIRNDKPADSSMGDAQRTGAQGPITVELTKPGKKTLTLKPGTYYPVQHTIALLLAAKAGRPSLRADLYDGSEKGDKAYDTLARIGKLSTEANKALPAVKDNTAAPLDAMPSWPVSISYFEPAKEGQDQTPVYELSFVMFENGVSRKLVIDYGEFAIKGELTQISFLDAAKCDPKDIKAK